MTENLTHKILRGKGGLLRLPSFILRQLSCPYPLCIGQQRFSAHNLSRLYIHHIYHRSQRMDNLCIIFHSIVAQLPLLYQLYNDSGNLLRMAVIL